MYLRGRSNSLKRILIHHAALNLGLLMRRVFGVGTPRGLQDRLGSVLSDNPTSERELYLLAQRRMEAAAAGSGLQAQAEQNTRAMLESMLRSLGYQEVTVTFRDPPT